LVKKPGTKVPGFLFAGKKTGKNRPGRKRALADSRFSMATKP